MKCKKIFSGILGLALLLSFSNNANADDSFERISGANRYVTSMETQKFLNSDILVLASGNEFADSLSAVNLCNSMNAKLLLVNDKDALPAGITDGGYKKVFIVGGEKAISSKYDKELASKNIEVKRIAGEDRYSTNKATLEESGFKNVGLASGKQYADALSSTRFLKEKNLGLLLFNEKNPDNYLNDYSVDYVFGGEKSVPVSKGERISGSNRYETSVAISDRTEAQNSVVVSGSNFADALSAVNVANGKDASIYIAPDLGQIKDDKSPLKEGKVYVVGGANVLSNAQVDYVLTGKPNEAYRQQIRKEKEKRQEELRKRQVKTLGYYEVQADPSEITDVDANKAQMEKHEIRKENGKNYLYNTETNTMVKYSDTKDGIINVENRVFLIHEDSSLPEGVANSHGKTYYQVLPDGLKRGWQVIDGYVYYFSPMNYNMYKSSRARGDAKSTGVNIYWFGTNGRVRVGNKPSGKRPRPIMFYGPTKEDYKNSWILRPDAQKRFKGQEAVNFASEHEGIPFKWFGCDLRDKSGVYCCGSVYSALHEYGIKIPGPNDSDYKKDQGYRMVKDQYLGAPKYGGKYLKLDFNQLLPGDEIFTKSTERPYHHAMLFMGRNHGTPYIVHATLGDGYLVGSVYDIPNFWKTHTYLPNAVRWIN